MQTNLQEVESFKVQMAIIANPVNHSFASDYAHSFNSYCSFHLQALEGATAMNARPQMLAAYFFELVLSLMQNAFNLQLIENVEELLNQHTDIVPSIKGRKFIFEKPVIYNGHKALLSIIALSDLKLIKVYIKKQKNGKKTTLRTISFHNPPNTLIEYHDQAIAWIQNYNEKRKKGTRTNTCNHNQNQTGEIS
jgi:hypothetical protein